MQPEQYEAWYTTPRGAWIGGIEYRLLDELLGPHSGETVLDVGCGTGHFTRRFSGSAAVGWTVGADTDFAAARFASGRGKAAYVVADGQYLPFADRSFDLVISVTAHCFIHDARRALMEMLRVARRRASGSTDGAVRRAVRSPAAGAPGGARRGRVIRFPAEEHGRKHRDGEPGRPPL